MYNKINKKTAANKRKKTDRTSIINFGVIFCTVFSLIYVVGLLLVASFAGDSRAGMASVSAPLRGNACVQPSETDILSMEPETTFPEANLDARANNIKITVDDGGYNQKLINVPLNSLGTIVIQNQGVNPHSFVVPDLSIDTGAISPGQSAAVDLEGIMSQIKKYDYYSNTGRDDTFTFGGVIEVTE